MAALRGGQSDPFERLNAAFDGRPWPARAASQVLLNAQPVLRVGVAQIGRFRQTRQGFRLVTGHSPALFIQRRQVDLRPAVPVRLLHSAVSTDDVPSMSDRSQSWNLPSGGPQIAKTSPRAV